jgi:hypothetical protein
MDSHSGILTRAEITGKEHGTFPAHLRKDGRRFYGYELKRFRTQLRTGNPARRS